jgi:transposase
VFGKEQQREINRKLKILKEAEKCNNISFACRHYGISRVTFYRWQRHYRQCGDKGLINSKPCPQNIKIRVCAETEKQIIFLRKTFLFGPMSISWYLDKYFNIKVSQNGVRGVLLRHNMNILPKYITRHSQRVFRRYEKETPGHHVQVDVKFLFFQNKYNEKIKKF